MFQSRGRAWRRFQRIKSIRKRNLRTSLRGICRQCLIPGKRSKTKGIPPYGLSPCDRQSKQWKFLYFRSNKLARAAQLKQEYPRKLWQLQLQDELDSQNDQA